MLPPFAETVHTSRVEDTSAQTLTALSVASGQKGYISFVSLLAPTGSCQVTVNGVAVVETSGTTPLISDCLIVGGDGEDIAIVAVGATADKNMVVTCGLINQSKMTTTVTNHTATP